MGFQFGGITFKIMNIQPFDNAQDADFWMTACCDRCKRSYNAYNEKQCCLIEYKILPAVFGEKVEIDEDEARFMNMIQTEAGWEQPFTEPCSGYEP